MALLSKGIILAQHKQPALSRDILGFFNTGSEQKQIKGRPPKDLDLLSPEDIIDIASAAGIIDERDGVYLYQKLIKIKNRGITLVVDAIDDEPYVSSQVAVLLQHKTEVAEALSFCERVTGGERAFIAVYRAMTDLDTVIPYAIEGIPVRRIMGKYPAEFRTARFFKKEKNIELIGTCALVHLYRALFNNRVQTTAFVTVAGNCVAHPVNLEVSIGMTVSQILERCGLMFDPGRVVVGGPMTGISVIDTDNTLISPSTRAVLAFREDVRNMNLRCIGCGRCVQSCPQGLNPYYIYKRMTGREHDTLPYLDAQYCIGCGICSYVCPARLDVSVEVQKAKELSHDPSSQEVARDDS